MLRLFLLRHGQTTFSRDDRFCGRLDVDLDRVGESTATAFAAAYGGKAWEAIYASTRRRAIATARPLAERIRAEIRTDSRLDEIDYGEWQGLSKVDILARDPERLQAWLDDPMPGAPGGEPVHRVAERARAALEDIRARHADGNVLVVSHKTVLRLLVCSLLDIPIASYRNRIGQPEGGVTVFDFRHRGPMLHMLGDTSYLGHLGQRPAAQEEPSAPVERSALVPLAGMIHESLARTRRS